MWQVFHGMTHKGTCDVPLTSLGKRSVRGPLPFSWSHYNDHKAVQGDEMCFLLCTLTLTQGLGQGLHMP